MVIVGSILFTIHSLKNDYCNLYNTKDCTTGSKIYYGDSSYIPSVRWDDFIADVDTYINKAYVLQDNIDNYTICKEV